MTTLEKWEAFSKRAIADLKRKDELKFGESFLEYSCAPSFVAYFNILISWNQNEAIWVKKIWDIVTDREHYFERDNKPKALVIDKVPSINHISGKLQKNQLERLKDMARSLHVVPIIDPLRMFTLDGAMNTISLGVNDLKSTFTWHTLPDRWEDLEKLADFAVELCNQPE